MILDHGLLIMQVPMSVMWLIDNHDYMAHGLHSENVTNVDQARSVESDQY